MGRGADYFRRIQHAPDTSISGLSAGDTLKWNGTKFVNVQTVGTSFPSSPSDGDQYYHTTDDTLYTYDAGRGHWFGPQQSWLFGNLGNVAPGYLRVGNNIATSAIGLSIPFNVTIVAGTFDNTNSVTAAVEMHASGSSQGSFAVSAAAVAVNNSLDIDIAANARLGVYINPSVGTPSNVTVMLIVKRRGS